MTLYSPFEVNCQEGGKFHITAPCARAENPWDGRLSTIGGSPLSPSPQSSNFISIIQL